MPQINEAKPDEGSFVPPYPPSWFDTLTTKLSQLPGATFVYFLAFGLVVISISLYLGEIEGLTPNPFTTPVKFFAFFLIVFILTFGDHLDHYAASALDRSRSHFDLNDSDYQQFRYQLTTLPRVPAFVVSLFVAATTLSSLLLLPDFVGLQFEIKSSAEIFLLIEGALIWWLLAFGAYHTVHQLRVVSRIYSRHLVVNLNNIGAVYSLSRFTALSSLGVIIPISMAVLIMPDFVLKPIGLSVGVISIVIAGLTFILPLMDLHGAMELEKQRRLEDATNRYESLLKRWHAVLDAGQFEGSGDLNRAVQSMAAEKASIETTPTWPWQPGVFRRWIASLFLPLMIWLAQQLLGRTLGS